MPLFKGLYGFREEEREMNKVKSPRETRPVQAFDGHVRAFCTDQEQKDALLSFGFEDREIHMQGHGAETFETVLETYRGRTGTLVIAGPLTIFANTRKAIFQLLRLLSKLRIKIADIWQTPFADMMERALHIIGKARFTGDRRKARRCGSKGGIARGVSSWNKRDEIAPRWLIVNMVLGVGAKKSAALSLAMSMKRIADAICGDPQNTGIHKAILDLSDAWGRK